MRTKPLGKKVRLFVALVSIFSVGIFFAKFEQTKALGGGTVTYRATDDATVWNGSPGSNYGAITTNEAGHNGTDDRYFYVKFQDLTLPADATVTSARIKLTKGWSCSGSSTLYIRRVTASWGESTITYNNAPASTATGATTYASNCAETTWYLDATAIVNAWKSGDPNYGVTIYGPYGGTYFYTFNSTEYGTLAVKPQLEVTYTTPDPAPVVPEPEVPETGPVSESTPAAPTTVTTPSEASETAVLVPKLVEVEVNGTKVEQRSTSITVKDDDEIVMKGNAPADSKVIVTIDDEEFTVTADKYGDWELKIDSSDFEDGTYDVFAKAVTTDNKESEKVKLFEFEKKKNEVTAKANEEVSFYKKYLPYIIGGGILLLLVIAVLTAMYVKKHKHVKKLLEGDSEKPVEKQ